MLVNLLCIVRELDIDCLHEHTLNIYCNIVKMMPVHGTNVVVCMALKGIGA